MSPPEAIARPRICPFCNGRAVDTLAKVITVTTYWRCRECDKTWTIASQTAATENNMTAR
jgi:ribosomal protein L37AE/L43A